jgi:phasin family protein
MAASDKNPFMDMFTDFGKSMNLPSPDIDGMLDYHRKNLQALQAATQVGSSTAQSLMDTQRAALEKALADISETVKSAQSGESAGNLAKTPMEIARIAFETTLQNSREMADIVQKGNEDTYNLLKDRVMESIEELSGKKG